MKLSELPLEVQKIASSCLAQLIVDRGEDKAKSLALSVREAFISMYEAEMVQDAFIERVSLQKEDS